MIEESKRIEKRITELESQFEKVMGLSRSLIRTAGKSMTAMHTRDLPTAKKLVAEMSVMVRELRRIEKGMEHYSMQAHQEYTEAMLLYSIINKRGIPAIREIGETEVPYLLGMMDVVGELKREAFEEMRKGNLREADRYYRMMLEIYDSTVHFRFASSLVPDFRRKQDVARIQIESTISELVSLESRGKRSYSSI